MHDAQQLKICSIFEEKKCARKIFCYHTLQYIYRTLQFIVFLMLSALNKTSNRALTHTYKQARNQGVRSPPRNFFALPGKICWTQLKNIGHGALGKLFAPPGVPSWLRACL